MIMFKMNVQDQPNEYSKYSRNSLNSVAGATLELSVAESTIKVMSCKVVQHKASEYHESSENLLSSEARTFLMVTNVNRT